VREFWQTLKQTAVEFREDRVPRLAAALAYYTVFSLAPLLVIVIAVAGLAYGSTEARSQLVAQLQEQFGPQTAGLIETMIKGASRGGSGVLATIVGIGALLIGATSVFVQLQRALNEIWDAAPDRSGGLVHLLLVRLQGLGLVLGLGLLLIVSFAVQAALNVIISNFAGILPGSDVLWFVANQLLTLAVFMLVFAAIFRVLPDVDLSWRNVLAGALLTAVLFKIGEVLIGIYLGVSGVRSAYGAAGSLVVLLLWVYFSAQILLFGAEYTQVATRRRGQEEPAAPEAADRA
jgi:membrane protein